MNMHENPKVCANRLIAKLLVLFALILLPVLSWAEAGKAIFVLGDVKVLSQDGTERVLKRGGLVNAGETIVTSDKGQAQIKMHDDGLIAVRPDSKFRIDEFVHTNDVNKDKDVFTLVKGSFRSITGSIGHKNKQAYKVKTPVATIGIRGTDYTARLCEGNCGDVNDGLYVGVMSGGVYLMNEVAILDVSPGEYGYVESVYAAPVYLDKAPGDLLFAQNTSTGNKSAKASSVDESTTLVASGADPLVTPVLEPVTDPSTYAMTKSLSSFGADDVSNTSMVADASIARNNVSWGHWSSGSADIDGSTLDVTDTYWIKGQDLDQTALATKSGSLEYFVNGGTTATTTTEGVQSFSYFMAHFDTSTLDMDIYVGKSNVSGQDWGGSVTGAAIDTSTGKFSGNFDMVTAPAATLGTPTGSYSGAFVGDANSAIVAYSLNGTTAIDSVNHQFNGTALFEAP